MYADIGYADGDSAGDGCASVNPAKVLGVFEERGSIEAGKVADVVLLDESLQVQAVVKDGVQIR